jgi:hypothetical protein
MDFVGPLPKDGDFDMILTLTNHLGSDIQIVPTMSTMTAEQLAEVFFEHWYCKNRLLLDLVSDHDKLFVSHFWKHLHKLTGVKLKMSLAYHPQTDRASEQTNKMVVQCIHYAVKHVKRVGSTPYQKFVSTS